MGDKAGRESVHGSQALCPARHKSHGESPRWGFSPLGWTGTVAEPRQLESRDPNHIPVRGETKVFPLLLEPLVTVEDVLNDSSYAACGESSSLKKRKVKLGSQQYLQVPPGC